MPACAEPNVAFGEHSSENFKETKTRVMCLLHHNGHLPGELCLASSLLVFLLHLLFIAVPRK